MTNSDLQRLRFLLAGLREPAPAEESERQAQEANARNSMPRADLRSKHETAK